MKILLLLLLLPLSLSASRSAIEVLSASGLEHSVAKVKTIYANSGDYIFYKTASPSNGMLLFSDDKVVEYDSEKGNKVVVAVVKSYKSVGNLE
jgi:hypothetical protein